jgi:transcriptional regulator with XRE-family HTH domain
MKRISLKQLRESRGHSQVGVAAAMGISQPAVSKLERRTDISIVALGDYIAALGGALEVTARFADGSVSLAVGLEAGSNEVVQLASREARYAQRAPSRKVAERTGFVMPEDWTAEVARIRAMPPDARMEEVANFSEFYAAASRRG